MDVRKTLFITRTKAKEEYLKHLKIFVTRDPELSDEISNLETTKDFHENLQSGFLDLHLEKFMDRHLDRRIVIVNDNCENDDHEAYNPLSA